MKLDEVRISALNALAPLKPARLEREIYWQLWTGAKRTDAGRSLPAYYLVYFLLVDLLGFPENGQWEKTAWSVSVEFEDTPFLIEHRKFGLGIFGLAGPDTEAKAKEVAVCIHRAVKKARPYFDWRAEEAAKHSQLNVVNRSRYLVEHVHFHLERYADKVAEALARKDEVVKTQVGPNAWTSYRPTHRLRRDAKHYAMAAIEGFFSWTEHVFIHIAVLRGVLSTGEQVGNLARADWSDKYRAALDVQDAADKRYFDELLELRRRFRNFVAHGSFGKDGEAFSFHSGAGAVPMLLPHKRDKNAYRFGSGVDLRVEPSIELIRSFMDHIWTGQRAPAKIYIQDYELPAILTHVSDGTYASAMHTVQDMEEFAGYLAHRFDAAANMDF